MEIQKTVLKSLIFNEAFARATLPFLKPEYFEGADSKLYEQISEFYQKYDAAPDTASLAIVMASVSNLQEEEYTEIKNDLAAFEATREQVPNYQWLLENTEKMCQDRALYLAVSASVSILSGKEKNLQKGAIPSILQDALAVSFDTNIGHDFVTGAEERFNFYHDKVARIPFGLSDFNKITGGGLPAKTLNIILAGTGVGKSLFMCDHAAFLVSHGYNVLYVTLEMAEMWLAKRVDANLLNIPIHDLENVPKADYDRRMEKLKKNIKGRLVFKEYPPTTAGVLHFEHLMNELSLKQKFKPDIVFIDYLNLCTSSRIKMGNNVNSYTYVKSIAEELRGFAVKYNIPVVTATQTNRTGFSSSDPGLDDTSESFGLPMTADFQFVLVSDDELEALGQMLVKQLKNRYEDMNLLKRFIIGCDKAYMRLHDVEAAAQKNLTTFDLPKKPQFPVGVNINKTPSGIKF